MGELAVPKGSLTTDVGFNYQCSFSGHGVPAVKLTQGIQTARAAT